MPARFTNLRPAEAKPVDRLRALHTPLYAQSEASAFRDSIIAAGLPAGIALAAARIANPDFAARAEYAVRGDLGSGSSPLGAPSFVALARVLVRAKGKTLAGEVGRGELSPDLAAHIAATGSSTAAAPTLVSDDLLSLYLVPGAFSDYRRLLGWLLKLSRLVSESGQSLGQQLLPSPAAIVDDLHGPWPDNMAPFVWDMLLVRRILLPAGVAYRRPPAADPGPGGGHTAMTGALAKSGLSPADIRQTASITSGTAAAAGAGSGATDHAAQSKAANTDHRD